MEENEKEIDGKGWLELAIVRNKDDRKPLVVLTGPTAVGKTALSISLAKAINGEIISADSMQVYKYMDIGSAKIMPEEMQGVRHYLVDEFMPEEDFNVVKFQQYACKYMEEIYEKGKVPILVGGTGFYIQAVLNDIDFTENEEDTTLRCQLEQFAREHGPQALHDQLAAVDPKAAEEIHPNNCKRVIRAIEFYQQTGQRISDHNQQERAKTSPYNSAYFVLTDDRQVMYDRINLRVDLMMEQGLVDEVKKLRDMGYTRDMVSMQGLGYKEILDAFDGKWSMEEAVEIIKRDTRHFAKRQLTWFKREQDVIWVDKREYDRDNARILEGMLAILKEKKIIK